MDKTLERDLALAASERESILAFFGNFEKAVLSFVRTYQSEFDRWKKAISDQDEADRQAVLKMEETHRDQRDRLTGERDRNLSMQEFRLKTARERRDSSDNAADQSFQSEIKKESDSLNVDLKNCKAAKKDWADRLDRITEEYDLARSAANSKQFDRVTEMVSAQTYNDETDALRALSDDVIDGMYRQRVELQNKRASLISLVFRSARINTLCREIRRVYLDAAEANRYLLTQTANKETLLHRRYESQRARLDKTRYDAKRRSAELFNAENRKIEGEKQRLNAEYNAKLQALKRNQDAELQTKKATIQKSRTEQCALANEEAKRLRNSFGINMESAFPPKQVKIFIDAAWTGRTNDFTALPEAEAERNVFIGSQMFDVKSRGWYVGEGAGIVWKLMAEKYSVLFLSMEKNGKTEYDYRYVNLPYKLSLERGENLYLSAPEDREKTLFNMAQSIMIRMLWAIPAQQSQMLLADLTSMSSLSNLTALDPATDNKAGIDRVSSIIYGEAPAFDAARLRQNLTDVGSRYSKSGGMRAGYTSLRDYNSKNPMNKRQFILSLIHNFEDIADAGMAHDLTLLSKDCGEIGFSSILTGKKTAGTPKDEKLRAALDTLKKAYIHLELLDKRWFRVVKSDNPTELGAFVCVAECPESRLPGMKALLRTETLEANKSELVFSKAERVFTPVGKRYQGNSSGGVVIPVGYYDAGAPFNMIFDDSRVHTLLNGNTGSGKTNFLHVLITNGMLRYSPDELEFYLIDFKHGSEFNKYKDYNLPAIRALSLDNAPEFALKILWKIKREIQERVKLFENDKQTELNFYNAASGSRKKLSRIVLVVDELYTLVSQSGDTEYTKKILDLLDEFAHQSRAYGVHVLISSQDLHKVGRVCDMKDEFKSKIILGYGNGSEEAITSLAGSEAAEVNRQIKTDKNGTGIVCTPNPEIMHTAFIKKELDNILAEIGQDNLREKRYAAPMVLVEDTMRNQYSVYSRFLRSGDLSQAEHDDFYMGELFSETSPEEAVQLSGRNLCIAGGISENAIAASRSMCFYFLLSLLLQKKNGNSMNIYFFSDIESGQNLFLYRDRAAEMAQSLHGEMLHYVSADQLGPVVGELCGELYSRMSSGAARPEIWLILDNVVRGVTDTQVLSQLHDIILEGPKYGIRTMLKARGAEDVKKLDLQDVDFARKIAMEMDKSSVKAFFGREMSEVPSEWYGLMDTGEKLRGYSLIDPEDMEALKQKLLQ